MTDQSDLERREHSLDRVLKSPWDALEPGSADLLRNFASQISQAKADLIIGMARKSVCVVDALTEIGFLRLQTPMYSDRVLEMDTSWLSGKRVLLLDDVLISGSSLHNARELLQNVGAEVSTLVAVTNEKWWSRELIAPDYPYALLDNQACMNFSRQLIDFLALTPRPYNIDWPMHTARGSSARLISTLDLPGCQISDTATSLQKRAGILSCTIELLGTTLQELDASLGYELSSLLDLAKVRVLIDTRPARPTMRVFPICVLSGITHEDAKALATLLVGAGPSGYGSRLLTELQSGVSQIRFIQYALANRLGRIWQAALINAGLGPLQWHENHTQAIYLFGPVAAPMVVDASQAIEDVLRDCPELHPAPRTAKRQQKLPLLQSTNRPNAALLQAQLTHPFIQLYRRRELPARRLLLKYGTGALAIPRFKNLMKRLQEGITVDQLVELARTAVPSLGYESARYIVSHFIDIAVDAGIAVPIVAMEGGRLIRSYRHGEDVAFGEAEAQLTWIMLDALDRQWERERSGIPHIIVEKSVVVLLRYGIYRRFFESWEGRTSALSSRVGIRFRLHGAVTYGEAISQFRSDEGWPLTDRLTAMKVLQQESRESPYTLGRLDFDAPMDGVTVIDSKSVGRILGILLSKIDAKPAPMGSDELTILASCARQSDLLKAVAAEVYLAKAGLGKLRELALDADISARERIELIRRTEVYTAMNSGVWKFRSFQEGKVEEIISRASEGLSTEGDKDLWDIITFTLRQEAPLSPDGLRCLDDMATWLISVSIATRVLLLGLLVQAGPVTQRSTSLRAHDRKQQEYLDSIEELIARHQQLLGSTPSSWRSWVSQHVTAIERRALPGPSLVEVASRSLFELASRASILTDRAEALTDSTSSLRAVREYRSFLIICTSSTNADEDAQLIKFIARVVQRINQVHGASLRVLTLPEIDGTVIASYQDQSAVVEYARFCCALLRMPRTFPVAIGIVIGLLATEVLFQPHNTSESFGQAFLARVAYVTENVRRTMDPDVAVTTIMSLESSQARLVKDEIARLARNLRWVGQPTERTIQHHRGGTWSQIVMKSELPSRPIKYLLGIVTIKPVETAAMRAEMEKHGSVEQSVNRRSQRRTYVGVLSSGKGEVSAVALTQALDQNDRSVVLAYSAIVDAASPRYPALVGIAGSIHKDLKLGDVVIGSQIIYYDERKEAEDGVHRRGTSSVVDARVRHAINAFLIDKGEPAEFRDSNDMPFRVFFGPIGTGNAVVASKKSDIRVWLERFNDKVMAVETEAGGFAQAFYEKLEDQRTMSGYLVVRGISDAADQEKDDNSQDLAARHAAQVLNALTEYL